MKKLTKKKVIEFLYEKSDIVLFSSRSYNKILDVEIFKNEDGNYTAEVLVKSGGVLFKCYVSSDGITISSFDEVDNEFVTDKNIFNEME